MSNNHTGNFHALLLFKTEEELNTVRGLVHRMVERALALDGTCKQQHPFTTPLLTLKTCAFILGTGEHGVGIGKKEFLVEELGEGTVCLMKTIKRVIDPLGIMNPGKVGTICHRPRCCKHFYLKDELQQLYPDDDVVSHP